MRVCEICERSERKPASTIDSTKKKGRAFKSWTNIGIVKKKIALDWYKVEEKRNRKSVVICINC